MNRITLQFIPSGESLGEPKLNQESDRIAKYEEINNELVDAQLRNGDRIEIDRVGNLRYSTFSDAISKESLEKFLEKALNAIGELVLKESQTYSIALILEDKDVIHEYRKGSRIISEFVEQEFGNQDLRYTEMGDNLVKISMSHRGRPIQI